MPRSADEKRWFQDALDLPPGERAPFLDRVCAGNPALRARLLDLLRADAEAGDFLVETSASAHERAGDVIGRYRLLRQIGEGGFGIVWMAEQREPLNRQVALKIIKRGMDSRQAIARFEAERQALALMDHPHIARVLDGGETPSGRPFFVMELVRGTPITQFCDDGQLDAAARLQLFVQVCQAVEHAHQKGVIHRDLKPSNVLVSLQDGVAVPKVIDFGVAKAIGQELARKSLFTELRQIVGTPQYMAPEQAGQSGLDIDTRADVYSLGVLLYELLTGSSPFAGDGERDLLAMLRAIREDDPPKPSTHVSTVGEAVAELAKRRQTTPRQLGRLLRGDLDWIVMKALEKDRTRRYATASALAEDVQRHLRCEPVQAGPPSAWYRLQKYLRRHRLAVVAGVLAGASLLCGTGLSVWGFLSASEQRDQAHAARDRADDLRLESDAAKAAAEREAARAKAVLAMVGRMLTAADPAQSRGVEFTVRQLLDEFDRELDVALPGQPDVEAAVRDLLGAAYQRLGLLDKAAQHRERALALRLPVFGDDHEYVAFSRAGLAEVRLQQRRFDEAEALIRQALATRRQLADGQPTEPVVETLQTLADVLAARREFADAVAAAEEALALTRQLPRADAAAVPRSLAHLSAVQWRAGQAAAAEATAREAIALLRAASPVDAVSLASLCDSLGVILREQGRFPDAEASAREALALRRQALGNDHVQVANTLFNLALFVGEQGKLPESEALLREALAVRRRLFGDEHPDIANALANLAICLHRQQRSAEAEPLLRQALAMSRKMLPADHAETALALDGLGALLDALGRYDEVEALQREALAMRRRLFGDVSLPVAGTLHNLASFLAQHGKPVEAEPMARESLAIRRQLLGEVHQLVGQSLHTLALALDYQDRLAEAEAVYREGHEMDRQTCGPAHEETVTSANNLAETLRKEGKLAEAERQFREVLAARRAAQPAEPLSIAVTLNNLALTLHALGQGEEAVAMAREALALRRQQLPAGHPEVLGGMFNLACILDAQGACAEAEPVFRELLAAQVAQFGAGHAAVVDTRERLAADLERQGKLGDAVAERMEVLRLAREQLPAGDLRLGNLLSMVGYQLLRLERFAAAEPLLRECLDLRAKAIPGTWQHCNTMSLLGGALAGQGKHAEAERFLVDGYEQMQPPAELAFRKREALERLIGHYESQGKTAEAASYRQRLEAKDAVKEGVK